MNLSGGSRGADSETGDPLCVPIREAARRGGWGRDATYGLVRSGRLKTIRVGGRQLVPVIELVAFIERELANSAEARP